MNTLLEFDPLGGDTSSQNGISVMFQLMLELMLKVPVDPSEAPIVRLVGSTSKYEDAEIVNIASDISEG